MSDRFRTAHRIDLEMLMVRAEAAEAAERPHRRSRNDWINAMSVQLCRGSRRSTWWLCVGVDDDRDGRWKCAVTSVDGTPQAAYWTGWTGTECSSCGLVRGRRGDWVNSHRGRSDRDERVDAGPLPARACRRRRAADQIASSRCSTPRVAQWTGTPWTRSTPRRPCTACRQVEQDHAATVAVIDSFSTPNAMPTVGLNGEAVNQPYILHRERVKERLTTEAFGDMLDALDVVGGGLDLWSPG